MNNYPSWWNTTLTIYNKYEDPQTHVVRWFSTVVTGCFWKYVGNKITLDGHVIDTNIVTCRIPIQTNYLTRYQWESLSNDAMSQFFTLSPGDIIVDGEVTEEINEYVDKQRSSDFLTKYKKRQGCMVIDSVAINVDGDRVNEHYLVKGV